MTYLAEADRDRALTPLQPASCTYRIALGPRAGQKVLSLQSMPSTDKPSTPGLCASAHGFSLHAAVRWGADQRQQLEHLCRYIQRVFTFDYFLIPEEKKKNNHREKS
ncbi:MAG: transposase [Deltaproteobacteria bacterium]|nr:transposase [Deltaproteobacteria bacterium]